MSTHAPAMEQRTPLLRSRWGSFLAVFPLSVWTLFHLWDNLSAFSGAQAWEAAVTGYRHPVSEAVTFLIVLVPLFIHIVWGLLRLKDARPNNTRYGYYGNLKYVVQRLSALGVLAFLGAHIYQAFLHPRFVLGHPETFVDIASHMRHHPPTLIVYLLGTLGISYHLANGIQTATMAWGVVTTERSMRKLEPLSILFFLFLLLLSWGALYALWSAGAGLPPPA